MASDSTPTRNTVKIVSDHLWRDIAFLPEGGEVEAQDEPSGKEWFPSTAVRQESEHIRAAIFIFSPE